MIGQHNFISLNSHNQKEEPEFELDLSFLPRVRVNLCVADLIEEVLSFVCTVFYCVHCNNIKFEKNVTK